MATHGTRWTRVVDFEDDESREGTPFSTASNDGKRARRSLNQYTGNFSPLPTSPTQSDGGPERTLTVQSVTKKNGAIKRPVHQPGAIVRVKLTNFVTYTSAEFFPGPNLNMVIGPNGTGKSTLVCAICLGLGWGTQYLGRAKDIAEFVKHGCKEATIEIELKRATRGPAASPANPVITRTIRREGNKSTFTLDGTPQPAKAIMKLAQSFDIQIDNLCQFLPQDKVVEFAQMTPIQILESTQRAAASPEMLTMHETLKTLRSQQTEHMNHNKGDQEQLANLSNRQEMQRTEVERLRERAVVQKRLGWLQKCRPIPQYCEAKKLKNTAKERMKALEKELKALERESAPTLQKVNSKQEYLRKVNIVKEQRKMSVKDAQQECDRYVREIENHMTAMLDLDNKYKADEKSKPIHKQEISKARIVLQNLKNQQASPPEAFDSRAMNQAIQDRSDRRRALADEQEEIAIQARPMVEQRKNRGARLTTLEQQKEKLKTSEGKLENQLKNLSSDTFRAWEWIKENRDKFQQTVYGPPIIECSIKDPSRAVLAEACLQFNDFKFITTQCREDFRLLQHELVSNQRLTDISLRQCGTATLDGIRRPMDDEQMRECGIDGWVIDLIDGPATVLAMLCQERFLHQTATAARDISEQQYERLVNSAVKGYVCKTGGYQFIRRAEYGAAGNSARDISMKPKNFWTGQGNDGGRLARVDAEIRELKGEMNELAQHLRPLASRQKEIISEVKDLDEEIENLRKEKEEKQKQLTEYKSLGTKVTQIEARIASYQTLLQELAGRLAAINDEKEQAMFARHSSVLQNVAAVHTLKNKMEEQLEIDMAAIEAQSDVETLTARNQHIVNTIAEKRNALKDAKSTVQMQNAKAVKLVEEVKRLRDEGLQLEERDGDDSLTATLEEISQSNDITEKDLDNLIEVETAKLELTEGGDAGTIKEFEERAKKIEKLQARVMEYAMKQADYMHAIREVRDAWEPELDRLIAKISDAFGDSFARIGCAGQVEVHKASSDEAGDCSEEMGGVDNGLDFANWAIHILVKFREQEPLTLLDSHRQSGGERAVSTIFYLMALQSLSRAPFRVVDEINQGMDPRNERMVHGRMVDIAAADENGQGQGSQYFLITPKLLSGLKYKPGMTVLCIVSGENMPPGVDQRRRDENGQIYVEPGRKIDFASFARMARNLGMGRPGPVGGTVRLGAPLEASFGTLNGSQSTELGVVGA